MNNNEGITLIVWASVALAGAMELGWLWWKGWGGRRQTLVGPKDANSLNKLYLLLAAFGLVVLGGVMLASGIGVIRRGRL